MEKITDEVLEEVLEWQKRPLEPLYPILYLDAIVIKVRDGHQVQNRAAHIAVGVDMEGVKHVLGIWVEASAATPSQPTTPSTTQTPRASACLVTYLGTQSVPQLAP